MIVSSFINIIRYLFFVIPYTSIQVSKRLFTFYPTAIKNLFVTLICILVGFGIKKFTVITGWISFILNVSIFGIVIIIIEIVLLLNRDDRERIYKIINIK